MFPQTPNGNIRSNSNEIVPQKVEDVNMSAYLSCPMIPPFVKRKLEMLKDQSVLPHPKTSLSRKWQPPPFSKKEAKQSASIELERAKLATPNAEPVCFPRESLKKISEASGILQDDNVQPAPKQHQPPCKRKCATTSFRETRKTGKINPFFVSDQAVKLTRTLHERTDGGKSQNQSYSSAFLTSDPRVKDCGMLNKEEQNALLQKAKAAKAVMLTVVYRDGTSLLDPEQVSYSLSTMCVLHSFCASYWLNTPFFL